MGHLWFYKFIICQKHEEGGCFSFQLQGFSYIPIELGESARVPLKFCHKSQECINSVLTAFLSPIGGDWVTMHTRAENNAAARASADAHKI